MLFSNGYVVDLSFRKYTIPICVLVIFLFVLFIFRARVKRFVFIL